MPDMKSLREGRISDGSQFKVTSTVAEKAESRGGRQLATEFTAMERRCCLFFTQSRALTHRMVLLPFMADHPASS